MKRRTAIGGLAAALIAAGGAAWKLRLFAKRYPPTPYDDLLNQIVDREPAARLGAVVVRARPDLTAQGLATILRQPGETLAERAVRDADQNRLMEADGWLVPESVGLYAALAAKME
jgi:hypothetical protein